MVEGDPGFLEFSFFSEGEGFITEELFKDFSHHSLYVTDRPRNILPVW